MNQIRKQKKTFYFSVEGDTEKWYFDWLERQINASDEFKYLASIQCKVGKDPVSFVKTFSSLYRTTIWHIFDYESSQPVHTDNFKWTLGRMKEAARYKTVSYRLGYSNFTFDLWIILHKEKCNAPLTDRSQYISHINHAFHKEFIDMDDYKHEDHFKSLLKKCTLDDVREAIKRAQEIEEHNQECGYRKQQYKGFQYYRENPATDVWKAVSDILSQCEH